MNRLSALLDLPVLVTKVWRQNQTILMALGELGGRIRILKEITVSYGEDVKDALLELDTELDRVADDIDAKLEGVDDDTARAIRERTQRLRDLHPQDEVPGVPAGEPQPGAETGGDGSTPPSVEPAPETSGSPESQGL